MSAWETVVGLEVHVQLRTRTKMFCACPAAFGDPPNTNVCPVCLGLPGALPVPNEHALRLAARAAFALGLAVHRRSAFARKHYFYPDLPKGYQISQHAAPLSSGGRLEIASPDRGIVTIGITRIHVEEDAGKSLHDKVPGMTAVDFNRAGVPLIEIVAEPDLRSPAEARAFLTALKQVLLYLAVSDCSMEEGSLRVDANVSVHPVGSAELRTRCEIKNLNSFANVERAIAAERDRQVAEYGRGGLVAQRTLTFDAAKGEVRPLRAKEESHDYRYFPEPDLPPLVLEDAWLTEVRASLPELPAAKRARFAAQYRLSPTETAVVTATAPLAAAFEAFVALAGAAHGKEAWNWFANDLLALSPDGETIPLPLERAAAAVRLVQAGRIGHRSLRPLLARMMEAPGREAAGLAAELGLVQVSDAGAIGGWVRAVLAAHPGAVARYRGGEARVFGFLVGQVMKLSNGRADAQLVHAALGAALKRQE